MTPILSVTEVTRVIRNLFDANELLNQVYIRGEISNFKHYASGHMYFTLKDANSQVRCVMFRNNNILLNFNPTDGMKVVALGNISVYEKAGVYQLYVQDMQPDGIGALHLAFEKLKMKLEKEGLFDIRQKKQIPFLPKKIALVTSIKGAAIRDMLTVIKRRFPNVDILIAPVQVQGKNAADEICATLATLNCFNDIDVIIVGRGGGSIEELWTFNEEKVARAIFASKIPVISAVGHETDFTIADFVSDKRAPTPSVAGELVVPKKAVLKNEINQYNTRLLSAMLNFIRLRRQQIEYIKRSNAFTNPKNYILNYKLYLSQMLEKILKEMDIQLNNKKMALNNQIDKLQALNPLAILRRGYSICQLYDNKKIINKISDVKKDDLLRVLVSDGKFICQVVNTNDE